jgi:host factor-I protein
MKSGINLQDSFLNQVRRENAEVQILLVNGTVLTGVVKGFDNFTVILASRKGQQHLIYKHAIAQLVAERSAVTHREHGDAPDAVVEGGAVDAAPEHEQPRAAKPDHRPRAHQQAHGPRPRRQEPKPQTPPPPKKEGFNTLDLSQVKLGEETNAKA